MADVLILVAIFVLALVGAIILALVSSRFVEGVKADSNLSFTNIGDLSMERFVATWNPSPSLFVEKRQVVTQFAGEAEIIRVDNLPSNSSTTDIVFLDSEVGKSGTEWTRVFGDNGTVANSNKLAFAVVNQEQVQPDTNLGFQWAAHIP